MGRVNGGTPVLVGFLLLTKQKRIHGRQSATAVRAWEERGNVRLCIKVDTGEALTDTGC